MKYFVSINEVVHRLRRHEAERHYVSWLNEDEGLMMCNWGERLYAPSTDRFFVWGEDITDEELFLRQLKEGNKQYGYLYADEVLHRQD